VKAGDLVVERAVAAVPRQALDHGVHDLDSGRAARRLQALHVGQRDLLEPAEVVRVARVDLGRPQALELAALAVRAEVLHVDEQERGLCRHQRHLAAQHDHRHLA
jgi:hypothetical protein